MHKATMNMKSNKHSESDLKSQMTQIALKVINGKAETDSFDVGFASSVNSTGNLTKLSTIPQGTSDSNRIGDQAEVFQVSIKGCAQNSSADLTNAIRFILFRWEQDDSSAAPAAVTDILQTASPFSPYNRDNLRARKFIVLYDKLLCTGLQGPSTVKFEKDVKVNFKIKFQGSANTGTSHIYAAQVSDSSAIPDPGMAWIARVWYHDV
jgi:hypothetical protein